MSPLGRVLGRVDEQVDTSWAIQTGSSLTLNGSGTADLQMALAALDRAVAEFDGLGQRLQVNRFRRSVQMPQRTRDRSRRSSTKRTICAVWR